MSVVRTKHTGANNHGAGAIAQFQLNTADVTYMEFQLEVNKADTPATLAQIKDGIKSIKLKIDGETKTEVTAKELIAENNYLYGAETDGFLNVFFRKMYKNNMVAQDIYGIGCNDVRNLSFDVEYANHTAATDMKCELWMTTTKGTNLKRFERKIPISGYQAGGAGIKTIRDLFAGSKSAVSVFSQITLDTDSVDKITIKDGTNVLHESTKALRDRLAKNAGRTPQAGFTVIDFDLEGRLSNGIIANENIIMEVETTDAIAAFKVIQYVEVGATDEISR